MILDRLKQKIKAMENLHRLEMIKANQKQQAIADARYNALVEKMHRLTSCVHYAQRQLRFKVPDEVIDSMEALVLALKEETSAGLVNFDDLDELEGKYRELQESIKKEWNKHYALLVSDTKNTLKVIQGIDADKIKECQENIDKAAVWCGDEKVLMHLKKALDEAEIFIGELNLDQEIVVFLEKMNQGRATVQDLSASVLAWIQKESLQRKIKLSFNGR